MASWLLKPRWGERCIERQKETQHQKLEDLDDIPTCPDFLACNGEQAFAGDSIMCSLKLASASLRKAQALGYSKVSVRLALGNFGAPPHSLALRNRQSGQLSEEKTNKHKQTKQRHDDMDMLKKVSWYICGHEVTFPSSSLRRPLSPGKLVAHGVAHQSSKRFFQPSSHQSVFIHHIPRLRIGRAKI